MSAASTCINVILRLPVRRLPPWHARCCAFRCMSRCMHEDKPSLTTFTIASRRAFGQALDLHADRARVLWSQTLQDARAYGGSMVLLAAQQELLGKQMQSFERHMARLRQLMCVSWPKIPHACIP